MVKSKKDVKHEDESSNLDLHSKKTAEGSIPATMQDARKNRKKKSASSKDEDAQSSVTFDNSKVDDELETKENVKKSKKKSSKKVDINEDDDDLDIIATTVKATKNNESGEVNVASKKTKKTKETVLDLDEDDDDDNETIISSNKKKGKHKSVFELLDVEEPDEMDVDPGSDSDTQLCEQSSKKSKSKKKLEGSGKENRTEKEPVGADEEAEDVVTKPKKSEKGGKKSKKKKNDDEDEIEKMLAELELEYKGEKPKKSEKTDLMPKEDKSELDKEHEPTAVDVQEPMDKKKKKKKKKDQEENEPGEDEKVVGEQELADAKLNEEMQDTEESTVKTAAQKKKEKKEREKQKKLAQKLQDKSKKRKIDEKPKSTETDMLGEVTSTVSEEKADNEGDKDDGEDGDEKRKKKDKKKPKEKEEKAKKGPGKKQLLLMQEALKKIKEEEEKQRVEEEAKLRAAEEAERLRLEKIRLEKERKEKKKQKEKERRERLKAEGKLLTKSQKQQKARAVATLEVLKAQGFEVPVIGEKKEKAPRLGTRIRPSKLKKFQTGSVQENEKYDDSVEPTTPVLDADQDMSIDKSEEDVQQSQEKEQLDDDHEEGDDDDAEDDGDVKDAWDASSSSEDEAVKDGPKKIQIQVKDSGKASLHADDGDEEDEEDEDESSDAESDSDESGAESESGSESQSDESEGSGSEEEHKIAQSLRERALSRIQKRREEAEKNRSTDNLRSPIVCVLGHVDTGKTKILDKIRHTHVQDSEAGGITQQIGATMVPVDAIREQAKMVKNFSAFDIKLPGLLIIDTPGHESFSNLRSRGSSLCDIAILVVDIMHGLEPQTIESINLLKQKKTPFIVALNKIDRLYDWKVTRNKDVRDSIKSQNRNTQMEFDQRTKEVIVQFAEQGLNAALFYDNKDIRTYVSMVPTSASTGEGMGNLLGLVVELTQSMLTKRLAFSDELQATVLELKAIPGLGTTIDVILVNGCLREGDSMVLAGMDGPVVTQIRSLLMPQPLKELRVKNPYQEYKEICAAQGVKITAKDLDKVIAGLNLLVAHHPDEVEILKEEVSREFHAAMSAIKLAERGVYVQASTLGSLEALLEFLRSSKIPYSGIRIGPVVKRDVMKASIMLEHDSQYAVILAFDVKIERDAQELADSLGVKIFAADIIYHLFDRFMEYRERLKQQKRDEFKNIAVFPCKLRILPQFIFNTRDPIILGVSVEAGVVKEGTPLCVPSKEGLEIGIVTTIEVNHKSMESARKGQEVCIKVEPIPGESPKMFGRHFDDTDLLTSKITRQSIDACKEYFRDDLTKADWQLMIELKKLFQIL